MRGHGLRLFPPAAAAALGLGLAAASSAQSARPCDTDACQEPRRPGEVAIVLLGDSGYGQGGASEWGGHAQAAVARQLVALCPRPDLVFFLGDNIYWGGSPDLFGPRFDTMYRGLFDPEGRRVHAALGNHDVKGCQVSGEPGFPAGGSCLDALERAVREDTSRGLEPAMPESPRATEAGEIAARWLDPGVRERARVVPPADCPSSFDGGYEQRQTGGETGTCYASAALRHAEFGFGVRGDLPLRYYTVDWPGPGDEAAAGDPVVRVVVADSNTLEVEGGLLPAPHGAVLGTAPAPRRDALQALWIENQLRTAPEGAWTLMAMHHPPFTPRGCVFKLFGRCVGGHDDEVDLKEQLRRTWGADPDDPRSNGPHHPDLVAAAHNHFYARTHSLDGAGYRATAPGQGVRYLVTGGGGAPLYRILPLHTRYAAAGSFHHFTLLRLRAGEAFFWAIDDKGKVRDAGCFRKGEPVDRCIQSGAPDSARLVCGEPPPPGRGCPLP